MSFSTLISYPVTAVVPIQCPCNFVLLWGILMELHSKVQSVLFTGDDVADCIDPINA